MGNFIRTLLAGVLLVAVGVSQAQVARVSGAITTQNLVPTGTATAGSCVEIDMANKGTVTIEVSGTYTGALSGQVTTAGTWATLAPTPFVPATATGTPTATIASGATGFWRVNEAVGALKFRLCALAAVTGTGTVTLQTSPVSAGSGGGGAGSSDATAANQSTQITAANLTNTSIGATTDAAATSGGTGSLSAKIREISAALAILEISVDAVTTAVNTTYGVATATLANVAASATNVTCLASNASRKGATIYNDTNAATLRAKLGATASATSFTYLVLPGGTLELPTYPVYTGIIDCIWSAAEGSARVTER